MRHDRAAERGSTFFGLTLMTVITVLLVGAYWSTSLGKVRHVDLQVASAAAFNAAESGLNAAVEQAWAIYCVETETERVGVVDRLDGKYDEGERLVLTGRLTGAAEFMARVREVRATGTEYADVAFEAEGVCRSVRRTIHAVVRYGRRPSRAFDHAYFINNFGWLYGAGITVNGSVRANADFEVGNATVNGDLVASENEELGAAGTITGTVRSDPRNWYETHVGPRTRPCDPSAPPEDLDGDEVLDPGEDTNGNGRLDGFSYEAGYDVEVERVEREPRLEMPYMGDLDLYRVLAREKGGSISQGGTVLVDAVMGDDPGEPANLVLIGTAEHPLVIEGPVVVTGDLVIKGVVTGQGTIYAGRNVHILGDVTYASPPSWPKPMRDKDAVEAANAACDLVGLAAKGSVVLGDYGNVAWTATTKKYTSPPFTQPYVVDPTDDVNGYVTGYDDEGRPLFHGDYTAEDGGTRDGYDKKGNPAQVPRRYYESSFSDEFIASIADEQIRHLDAVVYTNHLLAGKVGSCEMNGTLASRDEAIVYDGSLTINYDPRAKGTGMEFLDVSLPMEPAHWTVFWSEGR